MGPLGRARTRRDLIKQALAGTAYVAPTMLSVGFPAAVSAATPPPAPLAADLALALVVDNPTPAPGATITFTVTVSNAGPAAATGVSVADKLPANLTFVSATPSQGSYDPVAGVWSVSTLVGPAGAARDAANPGGAARLAAPLPSATLRLTTIITGPVTSTATIAHSDQADPNPGNNSASVTVTPVAADVALTMTLANPHPLPRNSGTSFLTTVRNNGPSTATGVVIADPVPTGATFISATPSAGTTYSGATGAWTVGTLTTGASATLNLKVMPNGPAAVTNKATVTHSDQFDPVAGNNTATATFGPGVTLLFSALVDVEPPHICRLNVFNLGAGNATNVINRVSVNSPYTITNPVAPAGTTVAPTADPRIVLWAIPLLQAGIFIPDLTFDAPGPAGTLTVTQTVVDVDQFDGGLGNDVTTIAVA